MKRKPRYFSFVLRIWLAGDGDHPEWRASLEDITTGERQGFACLEDLFERLKEQIRQALEEITRK
jgi:hypothetical protein